MIRDKTILLTGGTSGIGLEMVKKLSIDNKVIAISRKGTLPLELTQGKYPVELYHGDIGCKSSLKKVFDCIQLTHKSIDVLINNAAIQYTPEFLSKDFQYDTIEHEVNTNFTAICHLTYLCLPLLLSSKKGIILNINSGLAITPKRASAIYCATKSALSAFSVSLRYQLEHTHVEVKQVFLPLVNTPMVQDRGFSKLDASDAADKIIAGMYKKCHTNDIGKVKLLRFINRIAPSMAARIIRRGEQS